MKIIQCEQRSEEWAEVRRGIPTASAFDRIVTMKGEPSKQRAAYLYELAAERLSGVCEAGFVSDAMLRGIEREQEAREIYAMTSEVEVATIGFCLADDGRYGCSPDGLVGNDGVVEIKSPMGKTAIEYLLKGAVPSAYYQQIQGGLFVTGRQWCDFVSYYPGLPLLALRVTPDIEFHEALARELEAFCKELDSICETIQVRVPA